MDDLVNDFLEGSHLRIDQQVGLSIDGFPLGEEFADAFLRVFGLEEGPVGLMLDAFPDGIGRSPEANNQCVCFKAGEVVGVGGEAAAGGDDQAFPLGEFLDEHGFAGAEVIFAVLFKNARNGQAHDRFDLGVGVQKVKINCARDLLADGGFSHPHKPDQGYVAYVAPAFHGLCVTESGAGRTLIRP